MTTLKCSLPTQMTTTYEGLPTPNASTSAREKSQLIHIPLLSATVLMANRSIKADLRRLISGVKPHVACPHLLQMSPHADK